MRRSKTGTLVPLWLLLGLVAVAALVVVAYPPVFGQQPNFPNRIFAPREAETVIPLPSSTVAPALSAMSTVNPTVTPTATPTQIPTSTVTFTPTATPYVFTDTIEDAWYLSALIGEEVKTGSNCTENPYEFSKYVFSNGECFHDLGEHDRNEELTGPYYLGLFNEMNPRFQFVAVHFYVFRQDVNHTHLVSNSLFYDNLFGGQQVKIKNENWVTSYLAWSIPAEVYYKLVGLGRELDKDFWFVSH